MRIARRMLTKTIEIFAPLFADVIVMATMGTTVNVGKVVKLTQVGDNMDVELFDSEKKYLVNHSF